MRPDGTRVKEASTIVSALPYVMPRRYDAQNFITEYADMEVLRRYIQEKRREGVRIPYMTLILAAYFKAYQENPKINRFIMNSKIYQRNHFCVSFVILKTRADGRADETSIKVFFEAGTISSPSTARSRRRSRRIRWPRTTTIRINSRIFCSPSPSCRGFCSALSS